MAQTDLHRKRVAIKAARQDDLNAVDGLVERVYRTPRLVPVVRRDLRTATHRARSGLVLVAATPDRTIVGTVTVGPASGRSGRRASPGDAELRLFAVADDARRRGIGEALLRRALAVAVAGDFRRVVLRTRPTMEAACRLYQRLGFVRAPELDELDPPDCPALGFELPLCRSRALAAA
ncbi:MAG: GNAT family N-acetyltransferase [Solirubrobacteraceae bacterium]